MTRSAPRLILAALGGGWGKTTAALGLAGVWRKRGLEVVPFKKGPDYIDSAWLSLAAGGGPCYNLDTYLIPPDEVLRSFLRRAGGGRAALIEGNRGLFDGMDSRGTHSTAELAKLLRAPVALVVQCSKVTRTAAAFVLGAQAFDPELRLGAVILNQVAGSRHEQTARRAIEETCGVPVVGAIPRLESPPLSDRHLGVVPPQEDPRAAQALELATAVFEEHVDAEALWRLACDAAPLEAEFGGLPPREEAKSGIVIGVIRDRAFQFYYPENLEALEEAGAQVVECSALADRSLPQVDALYIGGGFPETCAEALSKNEPFRQSVRQAAENGLPIYAECGGLMYLGESLELPGGSFPMAGLFPVVFGVEPRPMGHGYTALRVERPNPFYPTGLEIRGHEFHYSRPLKSRLAEGMELVFRVQRGQGFEGGRDGICHKNTLALYTHVHALGTPQWAEALAARAEEHRRRRLAAAAERK